MNEFVSVDAIKLAIDRCVTLQNLTEIDKKSLKFLSTSNFSYRVTIYQLMQSRSALIMDSMGEGRFAEKQKQLLLDIEKKFK